MDLWLSEFIDRAYVGEVLHHIYSSRLNIRLAIFSEGGYFYGEHQHRKALLQGTTIEEAVTHLAQQLAGEFPQSQFATWWRLNFLQNEKP